MEIQRQKRKENRCSTDLVVDNDVDTATCTVIREVAQVQGFIHNSLAREAAIAMHDHSHVLPSLFVVGVVLLGTRFANHNRGYSL